MKPRDRIVVFRLSQEEYAVLKEACSVKGARNLSEFTRSELLTRGIGGDPIGGVIQKGFVEMEQKIAELQDAVLQLRETLKRSVELKESGGRPAGPAD